MATSCPPKHHDHCITSALAEAEAVCERRGVRFTPLRRRVLELIWENHEISRAYDLLAQLQEEDPKAKPPTIYRTLDFLLEQGLIHRIESLNAFIGCDHPAHRHEYQLLICENCEYVQELHQPQLCEDLYAAAEAVGFKPSRQTMEVSGLCKNCASRQATTPLSN